MAQGTEKFHATDIAREIVYFILTTVVAFAYWMLVLLLISFITLSVLHFTIEGIFVLSVIGTVCVDIWYVVKKVIEHRRHIR